MEPDFVKYLPPEIITNILLKFSARTVAVSKCVCKSWLQLLESDDFISSHFAQSAPALALMMGTEDANWLKLSELEADELDPLTRFAFPYQASIGGSANSNDPLTCFNFPHKASIAGSVNGFLFLFDFRSAYYYYYVCNPITRESIELRREGAVTFGFGVSKLGQHKVVSIDPKCLGEGEGEASRFNCHVYTLGTGSWRLVEATDSFDWSPSPVGAFADGNLHWMVSSERISCFDLETERFSGFTVPRLRGRPLSMKLYSLRDSLGFCEGSPDGVRVAIWLMKEYGVEESWRKVYGIGLGPHPDTSECKQFHPIKLYENGDVLLLYGKRFYYYSKKAKSSREIGGVVFGAGEEFNHRRVFLSSMLHTPSMISLRKRFGSVENVISF